METNSRPEATASPVKQGQYSPRKRKDTTPKVNPQLAVELVYQELKRVEAYTKRIENAMEKGSQLEMSIEELIKTLKEEWPNATFYLFCIARTIHDEHANENL